ncbi:MAG: acyl carrier protein [Oscillospiraceae bacterium]|nr:acyl carrier protein [Oscillospiraceae bacterium]
MKKVFDRIKTIIVDQLGIDENKITPEASFIDDLGADSLDMVELIMAIEEEFEIEVPEEEAENITTVSDAMNYISSKIK